MHGSAWQDDEKRRHGRLILTGGSFKPVRRAKLFFLSKSGRVVRPASESRFDGTRCRIAGLQTPNAARDCEPADKVRAHKPVKCEFKMLPGDVHTSNTPVPNTLLGQATLFEFRGKLKESFRRRERTDGRNVREMRKSGKVAPLSSGDRPKSRTFRFRIFDFSLASIPNSLFSVHCFYGFRDGGNIRIVFRFGNRLLVF